MFVALFGLITCNSNCKMSQSLRVFGTLKVQNSCFRHWSRRAALW